MAGFHHMSLLITGAISRGAAFPRVCNFWHFVAEICALSMGTPKLHCHGVKSKAQEEFLSH